MSPDTYLLNPKAAFSDAPTKALGLVLPCPGKPGTPLAAAL